MDGRIVDVMGRRLLLIAVAAIAAGGCGSGTTPEQDARIAGAIFYQGGPVPIGPHEPHAEPGSVRVLNRSGRVVAQATVNEGQPYRFLLAPGQYRIEATSGDANCRPRRVSAQAHHTATASVYCGVK